MSHSAFQELGLPSFPILLAPLAGVSDHPFRRACQRTGADLTYVEMLSATALTYHSPKTIDMMARHPDEPKLGVQLTSRNVDELSRAVAILQNYPFQTIDINMGCPVRKVVGAGCGSAILKDPERVFQSVKAAVQESSLPITAKIRIGWDHQSINYMEISQAVEAGGAKWLTVHGRTRNDDYSVPVDLEAIRNIKKALKIPVIGNGNLFSWGDVNIMAQMTGMDGAMVSRGALGNPWVFQEIKAQGAPVSVSLDEWYGLVRDHLAWQVEAYPNHPALAMVCMRKHLLWYLKGWPGGKKIREKVNQLEDYPTIQVALADFVEELRLQGVTERLSIIEGNQEDKRFVWDPKWEMDREHDRGVFA